MKLFFSLCSSSGQCSLNAENYMLPCLSKQLLGFECPGCGLQRSVVLLLQGNFTEAFYMYPAIYPLLFLFGFIFLKRFVSIRLEDKITMGLLLITIIAIFVNFVSKYI